MMPRVVVTGEGMMTAAGAGVDAGQEALWSGKTVIAPSERLNGALMADIGEFDPAPWLGNKGVRVLDRGTRLLCIAAQMALTASKYTPAATVADGDSDLGLVVGTLFGGVHSIASFDWTGITEGPSWVSPMEFANTVVNAAAGQAAIKQKLRGVNSTVCSGLASGLYAMSYAADFLRFGRARYLLAGGMEEVCEETSLGFRKLGISSPSGAVHPFAENRDGAAPGEGAAIWMLETAETAEARGMEPMFEVLGFGAFYDAHPTIGYNPRGEGAAAAIRMAIANSDLKPEDIGGIIASANGGVVGDDMEARALKAVFGEGLTGLPICAPKALFGEAMGAGGAIGALVAGFALRRGELPPTVGASATNGLQLSSGAQTLRGENILINAFSCEGNNACLVVRPWKK